MAEETALTIVQTGAMSQSRRGDLVIGDDNPAEMYLNSLGSDESKRSMRRALNTVVDIMQPGRFIEPIRPDKLRKGATKNERAAHRVELDRYREAVAAYELRYMWFAWGALRSGDTSKIRAELSRRYKYTSANHALSALRGVLKNARRLHELSPDDYADAVDWIVIKGDDDKPAGRDLSQGEILALASACKADKTPAGARDAAIIGLLYSGGLRRAELAALSVDSIAPVDGDLGVLELTIRKGKGNKKRSVYVRNGAARALATWLSVRGSHDGPLFNPVNKGGNIAPGAMTTQAVYNILKKRASEAGIERSFSPHDFRRTFVGDMLERGADIATVQKMAGHANVTTTARYDRRGDKAKIEAAGLLHFPF